MNYYERIQHSLIFIEANLDNELTIEACAKEAFMSVSGYYRMFLSVVGYNVKEYIRLRRLTLALSDLQEGGKDSILTIAVRYYYNSADSFARAFRKQFGILPSKLRTNPSDFTLNRFERIDIMEKYFETENKELLEKYPDIKVIRELPDMQVACFTYFGPEPEGHAFEELKKWVKKNQISLKDTAYRIFGYNHPDPSNVDDAEELYGYEVCVSIPEALYQTLSDVPADFVKGTYDSVKRKTLTGGKYAVLSVKRDSAGDLGTNIIHAWKRFGKWMEEGKYIWAGRQYLEEHLGFNEEDDHIGGVELYMPVETAPTLSMANKKEYRIPRTRVALFRTEGKNGEQLAHECWSKAICWAKENSISSDDSHVYEYNKGFDRRPPCFHVIMISLPAGFDETACTQTNDVQFTDFSGGKYMTMETNLQQLGNAWKQMEQWRKEAKAENDGQQRVEEWVMHDWSFPCEKIIVCYPIQ